MATLTGQAPVGAASVVVVAENFEELDELDGRLRHAEVDGRRVFQLEHVPPGTYHVCGMATRDRSVELLSQLIDPKNEKKYHQSCPKVTLKPGEKRAVTLPVALSLESFSESVR